MVNCADYCMFISAPGSVFLFYLAILVSFGSETVYSFPKNRFESAIALFLASFVYGAFFAFSYYTNFMQIQRRENIENWINEHDVKQVEMEEIVPTPLLRSQNVSENQKLQFQLVRQASEDE